MNPSIQPIPLLNLVFAFIPALIVVAIMLRWSLQGWHAMYAMARMVLQLLLIGFFLAYIFTTEFPIVVLLIIAVMLVISSWIALSPLKNKEGRMYLKVVASIAIGCVSTLLLVIFVVLRLEPWFFPRYVIPLAGMLFANAMNAVSLAAERLEHERSIGRSPDLAQRHAFRAALIPQINTMLAVGLVSLPGMMTGQILSGVSPLIAVRYQLMILSMIFGSSGIAAACYLVLAKQPPISESPK